MYLPPHTHPHGGKTYHISIYGFHTYVSPQHEHSPAIIGNDILILNSNIKIHNFQHHIMLNPKMECEKWRYDRMLFTFRKRKVVRGINLMMMMMAWDSVHVPFHLYNIMYILWNLLPYLVVYSTYSTFRRVISDVQTSFLMWWIWWCWVLIQRKNLLIKRFRWSWGHMWPRR